MHVVVRWAISHSGHETLLAAKEVRKKRGRRCHRLPFPPFIFQVNLERKRRKCLNFPVFLGEMLDVLNHHRAEFNDIAP